MGSPVDRRQADVVPIVRQQACLDALRACGGQAGFVVYPGGRPRRVDAGVRRSCARALADGAGADVKVRPPR
jgi:hypothetical protein